MKRIHPLKKQLLTFIPVAVLFMLISVSTTQARYELERSFIDIMPQVPARSFSAMQSIERLNTGMMNRGTGRETSFSTQLWRDSASLCTNGAMYGLRKALITAEEFIPFSQNIIMQASGLKRREDAYLHSFSEEGFKDRRVALHQLHHFFFMRAAQIAQESDEKEKKQTKEEMTDRVSRDIHSELSWLSAGLPSLISINSINLEDIKQSVGRFDYLFFTLFQRNQGTIQKKVAAGTTPSWENEDHINFICDQGTRRLAKIAVAADSPLQKSVKSLQTMYREMRQVARDPQKRYALSSSLFLIGELENSLKSDPDGMFVVTSPIVTQSVEGKVFIYFTSVLRKERANLTEELRNVVKDLRLIEFLATPFNPVPPKTDPIEDIPQGQLPIGISIGKEYLVYPFRVFTFALDPHYVRSLSKMLNARSNTLEYRESDAKIYFNGFAIIDPEKERHSLKLWADQGHVNAQNRYASMLVNGEGGPIDRAEAVRYLKMVVKHGDAEDLNTCACTFCEAGELKEARNCFKLAADKGHAYAAATYAEMMYEGEGGSRDLSQALIYVKRALQKNEGGAQLLYGRMLLQGEDGPANPTKARQYVEMATLADEDNIPALELYALMLMRGEGGPTDLMEAQRRFKMGAQRLQLGINEGKISMSQLKEYAGKGSILAQEAYARMLMGTKDGNLKEARHYCKMAVNQGYEPAKELLAIITSALGEKA